MRIEPMVYKKSNRAGGAAHALLSHLCNVNKYKESINYKIFDIDSLTNTNRNIYVSKVVDYNPDVIAFSCYCWNIEVIKEYAESLKRILPKVKILFGGPEVSYNSTEILNENRSVDVVIKGEGELIFNELITHLIEDKPIDDMLGISFRKDNCIYENKNRPLCANLDDLTSPYLSGFVDLALSDGEVAFESVRGCMFKCSYCLHTKGLDGVRKYSMERVEEELKYLLTSPYVKIIWILDPTFNANEERALKILKIIEKYNPNMAVAFELRADMLTDRLIEQFSKINVAEVGIGIQTTSEESNAIINRKNNINLVNERIKKLQEGIKRTCTKFDVDLIYGLPGDDFNQYKKSIDYVMSLGCNIYYQPLRVFKGTELYNIVNEFNISYNIKAPFNTILNKTFSNSDMISAYCTNVGIDFFNRGDIITEIIEEIVKNNDISYSTFFERVGRFFYELDYLHMFRVANWTPDDRRKSEVLRDFEKFLKVYLAGENINKTSKLNELVNEIRKHLESVNIEDKYYEACYFQFSI